MAWFTAALYPDVVERLVVMGIPHPLALHDNMDLDHLRRCSAAAHLFVQTPEDRSQAAADLILKVHTATCWSS